MSNPSGPVTADLITDSEVEDRIREFFGRNYDMLRQEGGHVLAEGAKRQALEQSLFYWRKLKTIATSVTETEVKLALPGLTTPKGRPFVLEGVVDIVREGDQVRMYDLKTHLESEVRAERDVYEDQLNVYAQIWKGIRGQNLEETAIIATRLPPELRDALRLGDPDAIHAALAAWDPVVDLPLDEGKVKHTVEDFGRCIDAIEDGEFAPPTSKVLKQARQVRRQSETKPEPVVHSGTQPTFAQIHCVSCDGRFSCASHQMYVRESNPRGFTPRISQSEARDHDLDIWIEDNLGEE